VLLSNDNRITINELPPEIARPIAPFIPAGGARDFTAPNNATAPASGSSTGSLREVERQQILAALEQTNWHRGKTAEILGISPSTLYRRLRDYDLDRRG
jgi:DNA-binding NtrC family response regulator